MAHALSPLPDRPLSPAGWLPQGFVLVADVVFGAGTCGSGAVTFLHRIYGLLRCFRAFAGQRVTVMSLNCSPMVSTRRHVPFFELMQ